MEYCKIISCAISANNGYAVWGKYFLKKINTTNVQNLNKFCNFVKKILVLILIEKLKQQIN